MEYLLGHPVKIKEEYLILETASGMGYKIWTHPMDEYSHGEKYKIFIHSSTKIENNTLVRRIFGFQREEDCILFTLMLEIKGIGPKTSLEIVTNSSRKIAKHLLEENLMGLMSMPGLYKYAKEIMDFFRKPKNRAFIKEFLPVDIESKRASRRKEILDIAEEMEMDLEKTKEILDGMENIEDLEPGILLGKILERMRDGD